VRSETPNVILAVIPTAATINAPRPAKERFGSVRSNGAPQRPVSFYRLSAVRQPTIEIMVAGACNQRTCSCGLEWRSRFRRPHRRRIRRFNVASDTGLLFKSNSPDSQASIVSTSPAVFRRFQLSSIIRCRELTAR
jgi:hypothetical protein